MTKEELMHIKQLSDRIWSEIEKTDVAAATIKNIGEAVDILKDLSEIKKNCATIEAMDEYLDWEERDEEYRGMPYTRVPMWHGSYGASMRSGRSRSYKGTDDRERMSRYLERKMADASTDEERDIIRGCMEKLL